MKTAAFYATVVVLGMLSMGFQLLGSRLLGPFFGSGIHVWAWLISTFLAAFSVGSILGGSISRLNPPCRFTCLVAIAAVGIASLSFTAFYGRPTLAAIEAAELSQGVALLLACSSLFFVPVVALACFGPQCVQFLASRGSSAGSACGLVYGVSTLGNIAGVMVTAFLLLPLLKVSSLLQLWLVIGAVSLASLLSLLRTSKA